MRLVAIVLITVLFSCKASEKETLIGVKGNEKNIETTENIDFTVIKNGENSTYKKAQNIIITTQQEMDLAWGEMFAAYSRKPPIPMMDFETKQFLLVTMGEQASGGYSIKVKSITKTNNKTTVTIENAKPGKACNTTSALIYPFQLIEMPKIIEKLDFVSISKINECK